MRTTTEARNGVVRSYRVAMLRDESGMKPELEASHWVVGYTADYYSTPGEAILEALDKTNNQVYELLKYARDLTLLLEEENGGKVAVNEEDQGSIHDIYDDLEEEDYDEEVDQVPAPKSARHAVEDFEDLL